MTLRHLTWKPSTRSCSVSVELGKLRAMRASLLGLKSLRHSPRLQRRSLIEDQADISVVAPGSCSGRQKELRLMENLDALIRMSPVRVCPGTYCVAKVTGQVEGGDHFMVARDQDEVTVITQEENMPELKVRDLKRGFSLIEIRIAMPFEGVGFLAAVARTIADAGLNILIVSTFSKDYILLKEDEVARGVEALSTRGFPVEA